MTPRLIPAAYIRRAKRRKRQEREPPTLRLNCAGAISPAKKSDALDTATGHTASRYASAAKAAELMRRASALLPSQLHADVREEAAQAIAVDVLAGVVDLDGLDPRAVRRYVRAAYGLRDALRFKSLDAPINSDDGRTLGEMLAS